MKTRYAYACRVGNFKNSSKEASYEPVVIDDMLASHVTGHGNL